MTIEGTKAWLLMFCNQHEQAVNVEFVFLSFVLNFSLKLFTLFFFSQVLQRSYGTI
jgi:hypothetical protein